MVLPIASVFVFLFNKYSENLTNSNVDIVICIGVRSKENFFGGEGAYASVVRWSGGILPRQILKCRVSQMPFLAFRAHEIVPFLMLFCW